MGAYRGYSGSLVQDASNSASRISLEYESADSVFWYLFSQHSGNTGHMGKFSKENGILAIHNGDRASGCVTGEGVMFLVEVQKGVIGCCNHPKVGRLTGQRENQWGWESFDKFAVYDQSRCLSIREELCGFKVTVSGYKEVDISGDIYYENVSGLNTWLGLEKFSDQIPAKGEICVMEEYGESIRNSSVILVNFLNNCNTIVLISQCGSIMGSIMDNTTFDRLCGTKNWLLGIKEICYWVTESSIIRNGKFWRVTDFLLVFSKEWEDTCTSRALDVMDRGNNITNLYFPAFNVGLVMVTGWSTMVDVIKVSLQFHFWEDCKNGLVEKDVIKDPLQSKKQNSRHDKIWNQMDDWRGYNGEHVFGNGFSVGFLLRFLKGEHGLFCYVESNCINFPGSMSFNTMFVFFREVLFYLITLLRGHQWRKEMTGKTKEEWFPNQLKFRRRKLTKQNWMPIWIRRSPI